MNVNVNINVNVNVNVRLIVKVNVKVNLNVNGTRHISTSAIRNPDHTDADAGDLAWIPFRCLHQRPPLCASPFFLLQKDLRRFFRLTLPVIASANALSSLDISEISWSQDARE